MEQSLPNNRRIALFDVCHTLVGVTTITDFTDNFLLSWKRMGWSFGVSFFRHFVWRLKRKLRIGDPESGRRHLVELFKGHTEDDLRYVTEQYREHLKAKLKVPIFERLKDLKSRGYEVYMVSAGLDVYLKPFADYVGVPLIASVLEKDNTGFYTGKLLGVDCIGEGKVVKLKDFVKDFDQVNLEESFAFSDSAVDLPMLNLVGKSVVVDPDNELLSEAKKREWEVVLTKK